MASFADHFNPILLQNQYTKKPSISQAKSAIYNPAISIAQIVAPMFLDNRQETQNVSLPGMNTGEMLFFSTPVETEKSNDTAAKHPDGTRYWYYVNKMLTFNVTI